jgi:hypothetical protein
MNYLPQTVILLSLASQVDGLYRCESLAPSLLQFIFEIGSFWPGQVLDHNPLTSASVAGIIGVYHHAWLVFKIGSNLLFPGLPLNVGHPVSASWVAGITDMY